MTPLLRLATDADLDAIQAIYDDEVLHGVATFDTAVTTRERWVAWLAAHVSARHPATVAEVDGAVAGWASLSPWSPRAAYDRTAEVSVYIHRDHRGRGVGRILLSDLVERARVERLGMLIARVESSGVASLRLHHSVGFVTVGRFEAIGEKFGRLLDVDLLQLVLTRDLVLSSA